MDSNTNNVGSKKRDSEIGNGVDVSDSESVVMGYSQCVEIILDRVRIARKTFEVLHHDNPASNELKMEKKLKQAKNQYLSELTTFEGDIRGHSEMMQRKNVLKSAFYDSMDRVVADLRKQIDSCKDLPTVFRLIDQNLSASEESVALHLRTCVDLFAAFANLSITIFGYADRKGEVENVNASQHRTTTDVATDCLNVFKLLKLKGPYSAYDAKIIETHQELAELDTHYEDLTSANKELDRENEELDSDLEAIKQRIWMAEQEMVAGKEKAKADEEAAEKKLVELIRTNMEKQKSYVEMGERIADMEEKLKELPNCEQSLTELKAKIAEKSETLFALQNTNERTRANINALNFNIEDLKKEIDSMEKEHERYIQEKENVKSNMEIENREKQASLKEILQRKDEIRDEYELNQQLYKSVADEYAENKETARQMKATKKKNLRDKRKLKDQLQREKMMLDFSLGVTPK